MFKSFIASLATLMSASAFATAASAPAAAASGPVLATAAEASFFTAALAFLAGFLLTWPALVVLVFFGILFEHNEAHGWSTFMAVLSAIAAYFIFSVSLLYIAIGAVVYLAIGVIWSFWRYKRHAQATVAEHKNSSPTEKERALKRLHPKEMLGTITAWIMIWPFSMVENLVGDIINFVHDLVLKVFRRVYHRIYDSAVAALK